VTTDTQAQTPAYITRCRGCNAVTGAAVDDGNRLDDLGQWVGDEIAYGRIVERVTVEVARELMGSCTCKKELN
jgi:hypothetical protein